jgi:hypothetical protein
VSLVDLLKQAQRLLGNPKADNGFSVNRDYEVPWLCGYSKDGKTIYIDRRFNTDMKTKSGHTVDITKFLLIHESTEKALMDHLGYKYPHAHHLAIQAERAAVEEAGLSWSEYDAYCMKYVHDTSRNYTDIPPDIDLKPEKDTHDYSMIKKLKHAKDANQVQDLTKDTPQVKFPKLGGDNRPEQSVKQLDISSDTNSRPLTGKSKQQKNREYARKLLSGYKKELQSPIAHVQKEPKDGGIFDPYESKIAFTDSEATPATVRHEGHHKMAYAMAEKHGVQNMINLYDQMLNRCVPGDVAKIVHAGLQSSPIYKQMYQTDHIPLNKFGYQQEFVNMIGDLIQKGGRRDGFKKAFGFDPKNPNKKWYANEFNEWDNQFKDSWRKIVDFANNATTEHFKKPGK